MRSRTAPFLSLFRSIVEKLETRTVMKIALPAFLSQASFTITNVLDLMMIGTISPAAIAGVGVGGVLFWNIFVLFGSPANAMSYLCAQSWGAGKREEFLRRVIATLAVSLVAGLPVAIFAVPATRFLYTVMGAEPSVVQVGIAYFSYRLLGLPFELASSTFEGMIKATGDTRSPMRIRVASHFVNLVLNWLLIFGRFGFPAMGAAGAGLATFVSYIFAFACFALLGAGTIRRTVRDAGFHPPGRHDVRLILTEGVKITVNDLSVSVSMLVYTGMIARLGAVSLAASEIAISVAGLGFLPALGFGQAAQILIGQRIGAGRPIDARRVGWEIQLYGGFFMLLLGAVFAVFPREIASLYTSDPGVREFLVPMFRISAAFQLFDGAQIIFSFALRGAGDTTFLFLTNAIASWAFFVPVTFVIVSVLDLSVIWAWFGSYLYMIVFCVLFGGRYIGLRWERLIAKT